MTKLSETEMGHWEFDSQWNPEDWFGFVYRI